MTAYTQFPAPFQSGFGLQDGSALDAALAKNLVATTYGAIANGTTKATGTQIVANWTEFATVAVSGIAILPPAVPGTEVIIVNSGANTLTIDPFETSGVTVDGGASTTLSTANRIAAFFCLASASGTNLWISALLGAVSS
jgi:hypothetical protein